VYGLSPSAKATSEQNEPATPTSHRRNYNRRGEPADYSQITISSRALSKISGLRHGSGRCDRSNNPDAKAQEKPTKSVLYGNGEKARYTTDICTVLKRVDPSPSGDRSYTVTNE
jgi:hypothetical protein